MINPTDTAAADLANVAVGSTQNGGGHEYAAAPVRHSHTSTSGNGCPAIEAKVKNTPAAIIGIAACRRRSRCRSEDLPASRTAIKPAAKGSAEHAVARLTESVELLRIIVGSHNTNAYPPTFANERATARSSTFLKRSACHTVTCCRSSFTLFSRSSSAATCSRSSGVSHFASLG